MTDVKASNRSQPRSGDRQVWDKSLDRMISRTRSTLTDSPDGFPHIGDPNSGAWITSPDGFWTGGVWVGMLWLAQHHTGGGTFRRAAAHRAPQHSRPARRPSPIRALVV